jgi:hypothetical protein
LIAAEPTKEEQAKQDKAREQIKELEKAIDIYKIRNGQAPAKLKVLVNGKVIDASAIIDPWDKEFQYDAAGEQNNGKKADIWTETPDKKVIGNWPEKK